MLAIRTILQPTDFSERSAFALGLACSLARDYGARLILLHVAEPPYTVASEGMLVIPPLVDLEPFRERLQRLLPSDPKIAVEHRVVPGDPATEILQAAEETHSDVVVLGTHGRTGVARFLMGSVAEQVVRRAPCPVLVVKAPFSLTQQSADAPARDEADATVATRNA
jgi:nucleotide-binding universal stress UspA family protein